MTGAAPPADAAVHITSVSVAPAPAGTCAPDDGTCAAVDPGAANTSMAERPVAGNAAADNLLALLQAAGMGSPLCDEGRTQVQPVPPASPLSNEGRLQLWRQSPGSSGEGGHEHERTFQDARNVRQRLI